MYVVQSFRLYFLRSTLMETKIQQIAVFLDVDMGLIYFSRFSVYKAKLFSEATFFVIIFTYLRVIIHVQNGN